MKKMSCRIFSFFRIPRCKLVTTYTSSNKRAQTEVNPLDDLSAAGRQNHDGVLILFHSIGHGIESCNVPKPELSASNQMCTDDVEDGGGNAMPGT